ncbi:sensor histidine kinase [Stenotrophomonas sp. B1-1]|uniref:ATP-binding protein n=1 Tax=Stenotrophomonas sp. B1-1 TaxID=2710648 RepID=UPI0013DD67CC|nr:sensor histidine kinase [Stenotrophomonas sp. B1-1]
MTHTNYSFKTNTLLKNLVGKDLINDDSIAIVELVKNSYDAASPEVRVEFTDFGHDGLTTPTSRILISDRGGGMTLRDLEDKWLNIAYSEKKNVIQGNGTFYAGNKGVGRFSCDRLGSRLDLVTRKSGGDIVHLPINWTDFEIEGDKDLVIQSIPLFPTVIAQSEADKLCGGRVFPATGTTLVISSLRSRWSSDRLLDLKRALEKFLNPNQLFESDRFTIELVADDLLKRDAGKTYHEAVNGVVQNKVFEKLKFNATFISCSISQSKGTITTELLHEGEPVFRLVESSSSYPEIDDASIVIYYLNPYKKAYFTRQTGTRSIEFGSIFLFLNGFRVAPYGDRGDDWLGLDVRKAQGTARYLSSRDVVGRIEITDFRDAFQPVSSREGLKNTTEFKKLREGLFLDVLRRLERFVVDGLDWDSVPQDLREELRSSEGLDWQSTSETYQESWEKKQQRIALSILSLIGTNPSRTRNFWFNPKLLESVYESRSEDVRRLLDDIESSDPNRVDSQLRGDLSRIRKLIQAKDDAAISAKRESATLRAEVAQKQDEVEKLSKQTETYRAQTIFLQSVAPKEVKDLLTFHHQISQDSVILGNNLTKAMKALRQSESPEKVARFIEKAMLANKRMAAVAQFASKANFRSGIKKEPTDIPAFVEQYLLNVAKDFTAPNLTLNVINEAGEKFEVKASKIELSILIDNIISNCEKNGAKRLEVSIQKTGPNRLLVGFKDNGDGLSNEISDIDSIFEMGITTTSGSGLGLYHARQIAEAMGGRITASTVSPRGLEINLELMR